MVTIRRFLLLGSLALLAGCAGQEYQSGPGLGYGTADYRHFRMKILEVDRQNYHVKGEILDEFFDDGKWKSGEMPKSVATFRVRDLDHLESQLKVGQTYNFSGPADSIYLELYPEQFYDPKEQKKAK